MSSRSDSTSPGSASLTTDPDPSPPRGSLRTVVLAAVLPLCVVVAAGVTVAWSDARAVQEDLLRMFEELREVGLTRSMMEDLRGIEQWVEATPEATQATQPLIFDDIRLHLRGARDVFTKFTVKNDPSIPDHDGEEALVLQRIELAVAAMERHLADGDPIRSFVDPLALAIHGTGVMTNTVEHETREIGDGLDRRSDRLVELLVLFGLGALLTVGWTGALLLRRVLVPVRDLRRLALEVARGGSPAAVVPRYRDELGDLAEEFSAMATQVQRSRTQLEQRVEERSREVLRTARLAELGSLAAGIAHEVNNPIASIATCAEGLLRDGAQTDQALVREYLQIIRKEAMRTRDLTARLLRFARNGTGLTEMVWLGSELREVGAMFSHQFADAGVRLELLGDERGPMLRGDAAEWRQVLFNLLRNALDASPRGGTVRVRCALERGRAVVEVQDEGPGIPPADVERVFEPFFTTKAPGKGTGLGLAIVHRIVTGHGGTIAVSSAPGGGASFRIEAQAGE